MKKLKNAGLGLSDFIIIRKFFILLFITGFLIPDVVYALSAKNKYYNASACYENLIKSQKRQRYRDNWLRCIDRFQEVYRHDPSGPWAAAGLYRAGELYLKLYKWSGKKSDKIEALDLFKRIIKRFPKSRYKARAARKISLYAGSYSVAAKKRQPKKKSRQADLYKKHKKQPVVSGAVNSTVKGLRFWSNPNYTRIVIDADRPAPFVHRLLKKDPSIKKPQRLYVDLIKSRLCKDFEKKVPINDNLLSYVRAGQYSSNSVRVVVDIKSFKNYKIFSLKNPFRIVIDVWGKGEDFSVSKARPDNKNGNSMTGSALAKQLALGVRRIAIDAGHGGRDYGAPGYLKGVHEKKIVLSIAKKLAEKIRKDIKCEVIMTRDSDRYLTLEERTAMANTKNADLFISIHTNAARNKKAYGIETYFLNLATDDDAILVAARENATSTKNISDLQTILSDLMQNAKISESNRLACDVQEAVCKNLRKKYKWIKNKGVKQAPFYVLLGAQMPAILIETSFISNPRECKRLNNSVYQENLCNAIVEGIRRYISDTNPTVFLKESPLGIIKG